MHDSIEGIEFIRWSCGDLKAHFSEIVCLRKNYQDYPYLYNYDENTESKYFDNYLRNGDLTDCWVALDGDKVIGANIGCPMSKDFDICSEVCELTDFNGAYYFGDIMIAKEYQSRGIAKNLYARHISQVKDDGYKKICALIIERPASDPRIPEGYSKPRLWKNFGFKPSQSIITYKWDTIQHDGGSRVEESVLRLYEKDLIQPLA